VQKGRSAKHVYKKTRVLACKRRAAILAELASRQFSSVMSFYKHVLLRWKIKKEETNLHREKQGV
jgi:hypothetical protein